MSDLNNIHKKPRRRRIMRKLKITELSCVDRPAQAGAVATILKRDDTERPNYADIWCREQDALEKAAEMEFEDTVIEIQKRDDCDRTTAMTRARLENPEAWAAYAGVEVPVAKGKGRRQGQMGFGSCERNGANRLLPARGSPPRSPV